jgi:hypothetical protein
MALNAGDLAGALSERQGFADGLKQAIAREQLLLKQSKEIDEAEKTLSSWASRLDREPLVLFVAPETLSVTRDLIAEYRALNREPRFRGDVSPKLLTLSDRLRAIGATMGTATERADRAAELERQRQVALNGYADVQQLSARPEFSGRLTAELLESLPKLTDAKDRLLQLQTIPLNERADYVEDLRFAEKIIGHVQVAKRQLSELDQLKANLRTLRAKIDARGTDLLDRASIARVDAVAEAVALTGRMKVPTSTEQTNGLSKTRAELDSLLATIDAILERAASMRDIEKKGNEYARESATAWTYEQTQNQMTDRVDAVVRSLQKNGQGAAAGITGNCLRPGLVVFTALVVDLDGKPTIDLPTYNQADNIVSGTRRINSEAPSAAIFANVSFRNQFYVGALVDGDTLKRMGQSIKENKKPEQLVDAMQDFGLALTLVWSDPRNMDSAWRILGEIQTSQGSILIKVPTFEKNIRRLVESCRAPAAVPTIPTGASPTEPVGAVPSSDGSPPMGGRTWSVPGAGIPMSRTPPAPGMPQLPSQVGR